MNIEILSTYKKALKARNYALKTKNAYNKAFRAFFISHAGEIDNLTSQQINSYLLNLDFSPAKLTNASAAIKAYYINCLDRVVTTTKIIKHETTPEIFTQTEIKKIFDSCDNLKSKAIFATIYFLGLRRQEIVNLSICDFVNNQVVIRDSKGADRVLNIPFCLMEILNNYINQYIPSGLLFDTTPGQIGYYFHDILNKSGINKPNATPHDLRHSAAVHMLNAGTDIISIMHFLGHKSLNSTLIYTKFATNKGATVPELTEV